MHRTNVRNVTWYVGLIARWVMLFAAFFIMGTSPAEAVCIAGGTKAPVTARRPAKTVALRSGILDKIENHSLYLTNGETYNLHRVRVRDFSRYKLRTRGEIVTVEMSFVNGKLVEVVLR